jgi:hypothetical protein
MTVALCFAAEDCHAWVDRAGASLAASCLVTAADRAGASLVASYRVTAVGQAAASLDVPPVGVALRAAPHVALRVARNSDDPADRDVAARHRIAFRRGVAFRHAKAIHYAEARRRSLWAARSRVHSGRRHSFLLIPLTLWRVKAALQHAQPVCNQVCAMVGRLDCLDCG